MKVSVAGTGFTTLLVQVTVRELRARAVAHCRQELAPYKVPKQFAFVDALPATAVGKVDKNALRALGANLINGR